MSTDVREWLRGQGHEVPDKGRLSKSLQAIYDDAHPGLDGLGSPDEPDQPAGPDAGYDAGVTEADFPSEPEPDSAETVRGERKPRAVRTSRGTGAKGLRERIWGSSKGKSGKAPRKKHPRVSVKGMIEETWSDLAWMFGGVPPLNKILYLQAPFAGQVLEETVRGTVADKVMQPMARTYRHYNALFSLSAPLWVMAIMAKGERVADGPNKGDYTPATKMMFGGLRGSLLSMSRAMDHSFAEMREKGEELRRASDEIDAMIAWLFEMPGAPSPAEEDAIRRAQAMTGQDGTEPGGAS